MPVKSSFNFLSKNTLTDALTTYRVSEVRIPDLSLKIEEFFCLPLPIDRLTKNGLHFLLYQFQNVAATP